MRTYEYRLRPNKQQEQALMAVLVASRKLYNQGLKDSMHKASRYYVDRYQTTVIEDLHVANMVRNHQLAFAIADASWGMLRQFLEAKAESAGRQVIAVRPHYTSQKCSQCGTYVEKSLSVRTHVCPHCGYIADRDENAARNILQRGLQVLAGTPPSPTQREGLSDGK